MKKPTSIVTVNLTVVPDPSLFKMPPPTPPEPDLMPAIWRIPQQTDGGWRWFYVRRGTNELFTEYALCEQHTRCLELCPPDEKEMVQIEAAGRLDS